ncbi:hypothetical protein V8F20_004425 [Naviculisporaceae sp. PSN 640]
MANYTSTVRYRDPATSSLPHPRDRPFTHSYSHSSRPVHIIDSSDGATDDILNNTLTQRVLPALLNRSDRDGRPLKVVINQGNLYMEDSALDSVSVSSYPYTSRYSSGSSKDEPNTVIYNAPGSTMAITSPSSSTGASILRRPTSPLIRTVSPSDSLLGVAYDSGRRRSFYRTRSRSRARSNSRDRYGQHRRISYYDSSPPSPTYSSLSTITSSSTIGATGPGAVIDRRPLAMCLGCFKTQRVCSNGFCSACDFFPNNSPRGSGSSYEKEVYIERPDGTGRRITYESGGGHSHGHGRHRDRDRGVYYDEFGTRRARGVGGGALRKESGANGRREPRGRSRTRELVFEVEERESGRENDRFRAKERAWERMESDHMRGANGGGGPLRKGGRGVNGGKVLYDSDSEF